jgi:hypothetical protein
MPEKRKYLTEIPYKSGGSEHNRFWKRMKELTGAFAIGNEFCFANNPLGNILKFPSAKGNIIETELGEHDIHMESWWYDLLPIENLNRFEELLKAHKVDYLRNARFYELCCDETTGESESVFLLNHPGENLLFISSPTELFVVKAIAYTSRIPHDAKNLEKDISERKADFGSGTILDVFYNDKVHGIYFKEGACPRCYKRFEKKIKEKAIEITQSGKWAYFKESGAEKGSYESDPRIKILLEEPILDFNKRYFTS